MGAKACSGCRFDFWRGRVRFGLLRLGNAKVHTTGTRKSTPATDMLGLPHVKIYSRVCTNVAS